MCTHWVKTGDRKAGLLPVQSCGMPKGEPALFTRMQDQQQHYRRELSSMAWPESTKASKQRCCSFSGKLSLEQRRDSIQKRNSCSSIKASEGTKYWPVTLQAEPELCAWLITRILGISCSCAGAFLSQSSISGDCTRQPDPAWSQRHCFFPHRLQQWEMVPWLFPEQLCSQHGRDDQSRAAGDHEAHWTAHLGTSLWSRRKSTEH